MQSFLVATVLTAEPTFGSNLQNIDHGTRPDLTLWTQAQRGFFEREDGSGWVAAEPDRGRSRQQRHDSDDDASPPRRRHDSDDDASPPRQAQRHDSNDDASPLRRVQRHDSDDDASPPRRDQRHDCDDDASPPRRYAAAAGRHESDANNASPPRRRAAADSDDDASPPRRGEKRSASADLSPPRRCVGTVTHRDIYDAASKVTCQTSCKVPSVQCSQLQSAPRHTAGILEVLSPPDDAGRRRRSACWTAQQRAW